MTAPKPDVPIPPPAAAPARRRLVLDPDAMRWWHAPAQWRFAEGVLTLQVEPGTDFWQRTHYGFRRDDGHFLGREIDGDFDCEVAVRSKPSHRYDQAGLMLRVSADCWLKTSIEFEPEGPSRLGAVVTNDGWSDWSTQDVPRETSAIALRLERRGNDVSVFARSDETRPWSQLRIARLGGATPLPRIAVGPYACAPDGPGFVAAFAGFAIDLA